MTWPQISESTFPSKIPSHNSWNTTQRFEHNVLSLQSFLVQCLLSACWKLPPFLESIWFLKDKVFDKFIHFKSCVKSTSHYFCFFNKAKLTEDRDCGNVSHGLRLNLVYACCYSNLNTNRVGCPIIRWNFSIYLSSVWPGESLILSNKVPNLIFSTW